MTFNDIFKSSFLENVNAVSVLDMVLALALAFGLGLFIFFVYKKTCAGGGALGTCFLPLQQVLQNKVERKKEKAP